ncbi:ATP-binding protein [Peptococcaceae bacterium]|nr:ATP-binding protein [Peptococcaceae bacterium]MCL0063469.1 ATP-binding protein [Peptococcaceae bacterium]
MLAKLPIGIQTFDKMRTGNYIYVDKTKEAYELINSYTYAFLARPRRFGKSLFIDTLKNIFEGNKELFEGLYIYDKWNWDEKYPVIKIDWSGNFQTLENLEKTAMEIFEGVQENLGIKCKSDKPDGCFRELIRKAYKKYNQRVVILVDEYDKPILDVIENQEQAIENREFLKGLYSIIKSNDTYVKFCFLTGISKFSKASIFSGLNMLVDISLLPKYGNICGYTEQDIKEKFKEYLEDVDINEIREWYDGYWFLKDKIYNPFDILQCLENKEFDNYWFTSGNPSFLIKLIKERKYFLPNLSNLTIDKKLLDVFDIERIDIEVLLYQAGYLTIKEVGKTPFGTMEYRLYFPNKEVKMAFDDVIIEYLTGQEPLKKKKNLYAFMTAGDIEGFINTFKRIFASIPHTYWTYIKSYEGFYASIVYAYLQALGIDIIGEDVTNKGRIDLTVFIGDKIYVIEFKVITSEHQKGTALKQIKERKYHEKYTDKGKEIYLIGMEFSEDERNIVGFEWEKI